MYTLHTCVYYLIVYILYTALYIIYMYVIMLLFFVLPLQMAKYPRLREEAERVMGTFLREQEERCKAHVRKQE